MHFYGTSSGAIRAGAYAMAQPERVDRLVLSAFTYKGENAPTLASGPSSSNITRPTTPAARPRHDRIDLQPRRAPSRYDPAVAKALADFELQYGDQVPTGTYLDMTSKLPLVDPLKVLSPVLMLRGDHDGISTNTDLLEFYRQAPQRRPPVRHPPETAHSSISVAKNRQWPVT